MKRIVEKWEGLRYTEEEKSKIQRKKLNTERRRRKTEEPRTLSRAKYQRLMRLGFRYPKP